MIYTYQFELNSPSLTVVTVPGRNKSSGTYNYIPLELEVFGGRKGIFQFKANTGGTVTLEVVGRISNKFDWVVLHNFSTPASAGNVIVDLYPETGFRVTSVPSGSGIPLFVALSY